MTAVLFAVALVVAVVGCAVGVRRERVNWSRPVRITERRAEWLARESERSS